MLQNAKVKREYSQCIQNQEAINELISGCGDVSRIQVVLWDMFRSSVSNPEDCNDPEANAERCDIYRRLSDFLSSVNFSKVPTSSTNFSN